MSLNWNIDKVKDYKDLWIETGETDSEGKPTYRLNTVTEAIIWLSIPVGLGEITEKNLEEWAFRISVLNQIDNKLISFRLDGDGAWSKRNPTMEEIGRHIGFRVNVANWTRPQFLNNVRRILKEQAESEVRSYLKSKEGKAALA